MSDYRPTDERAVHDHDPKRTRRTARPIPVVALVSFLFQPIIRTHLSLEWMVSASPRIVVGTATVLDPIRKDAYFPDVKIRVEETIKGVPAREIDCAVGQASPSPFKEGGRYIAYLEPSTPGTKLVGARLISYDSPDIWAMTGERLTTITEIAKRTKEALPFPPAPALELHRMIFNGRLKARADSRLERIAGAWAKSDMPMLHVSAGEALLPVRNTENIALLLGLTRNPFKESTMYRDTGPSLGPGIWTYPVREAAKKTLDSWHVDWETVSPRSMTLAREMVRVPAGPFVMGADVGENALKPHNVTLDEFWIGKTTVTVAQFKPYLAAMHRKFDWMRFDAEIARDDHPMTHVSWAEAREFCHWVGGELPTEAQWEKAARGTDGRLFPWGDHADLNRMHCWPTTLVNWSGTAPVGSDPSGASPYGCLDMAGNVFQYCLDSTTDSSAAARPHVVKGGSFEESVTLIRLTPSAARVYTEGDGDFSTGFRVASKRRLKLP